MALRIEIFSSDRDKLGEGPLWDVEEERLYWIDSYGCVIHRSDLKGGDRRSWAVPEPIGSMALRQKGGAVLSLRSGFHLLDFGSGEISRITSTKARLSRRCSCRPCSASWAASARIRTTSCT